MMPCALNSAYWVIYSLLFNSYMYPLSFRFGAFRFVMPFHDTSAIDDPNKVIKVVACDGKTGDQKDIQYTNCKIIGNGSFGVVFQARLTGAPKGDEDIAIKKVLQDKRFKVG